MKIRLFFNVLLSLFLLANILSYQLLRTQAFSTDLSHIQIIDTALAGESIAIDLTRGVFF